MKYSFLIFGFFLSISPLFAQECHWDNSVKRKEVFGPSCNREKICVGLMKCKDKDGTVKPGRIACSAENCSEKNFVQCLEEFNDKKFNLSTPESIKEAKKKSDSPKPKVEAPVEQPEQDQKDEVLKKNDDKIKVLKKLKQKRDEAEDQLREADIEKQKASDEFRKLINRKVQVTEESKKLGHSDSHDRLKVEQELKKIEDALKKANLEIDQAEQKRKEYQEQVEELNRDILQKSRQDE